MGSGYNQLFFDPSACHGNMLYQFGNNKSRIYQGTSSMISMEENPRIRPIFTPPHDDIYDEEYYDEQLPEKKRRLTTEQVRLLEKSFETEIKLEPERKSELAKKLGLQPRQVAVWFQNRRARWKTKQLERDYDLLKSSYDSLVADYKAVHDDNEKLKSQVVSLTEKLEDKGVNEKAIPDPSPEPEPNITPDPFPMDSTQLFSSKTEDRLSSGSGGSAIVNEDTNPQLVADSGGENCYFLDEDHYPAPCIAPFPSDEDDDVFAASSADQHQHHQQEGETMGWWVW